MRTHIPGGKYTKIINHETMKFGGKTYRRMPDYGSFTKTKAEAMMNAVTHREAGRLARVVKRPDSWAVFVRSK